MQFEDALPHLHRYEILACSMPPTDIARVAWVGVHPFDRYRLKSHRTTNLQNTDPIYRILWIEIPRDFDYEEFDLHPEYITTLHDLSVRSDDELRVKLCELGIDPDSLNFTNVVRYPL